MQTDMKLLDTLLSKSGWDFITVMWLTFKIVMLKHECYRNVHFLWLWWICDAKHDTFQSYHTDKTSHDSNNTRLRECKWNSLHKGLLIWKIAAAYLLLKIRLSCLFVRGKLLLCSVKYANHCFEILPWIVSSTKFLTMKGQFHDCVGFHHSKWGHNAHALQ